MPVKQPTAPGGAVAGARGGGPQPPEVRRWGSGAESRLALRSLAESVGEEAL